MRKQHSTNTINKKQLEADCGMAYAIAVLGGRWKLSILGYLSDGKALRYHELKEKMPGISEKMLSAQLKELQADGLIDRTSYSGVPPRVDYLLSPKGKTLKRILKELDKWGEQHKK